MQRHDFLHEFDVLHQADEKISEQLDRRNSSDSAWIKRRRMDVPTFHQTEHLPGHPTDLQRLPIEFPFERIERFHDIRDRAVSMILRVGRLGFLGFFPNTRIGFPHHLLAEIDPDQIVLENVMVEHVLGCFAEIDDPLCNRRRFDSVSHILGVHRAGRMIIAADPADSAGDEVRVAGILVLHEDAVTSEDRGGAVALDDFPVREINLGEDPQTPDDSGDRIPGHLHNIGGLGTLFRGVEWSRFPFG